MTSEYNLADQTLAALSAPKIGLVSYETAPAVCPSVLKRVKAGENVRLTAHSRDCIRDAYKQLRKATRYTVDDSMVRHAVTLSMTISADALLKMISDAVPPNVPMWIEWNEEVRQNAMGDHFKMAGKTEALAQWAAGVSGASDYVGYLIEELDYPFIGTGEEDHYCFSPVYPVGKEGQAVTRQKIMCDASGFALSPQPWSDKDNRKFYEDFALATLDVGGELMTMRDKRSVYEQRNQDLEEDYSHYLTAHNTNVKMLLGVQWFKEQIQWSKTLGTAQDKAWAFSGLTDHIHAVQSKSIDWLVPRTSSQDETYDPEDHQHLARLSGSISSAGDARFLICLLHVLNYDWVIKTPRLATGRGGIRYGKPVKFNSHIVCEIDLPKVNGVSITPTDYLEEVRGMKRLHDVRGHFRRLRDGRRVWVKSHKRGNKELGTITKDYLLTNKSKGE